MHRIRLSTFLIGVNVGLLLLAVAGVATVAVRLLQQLADEQALARVQQAGTIARQQIESTGQSMRISAELLSERPTLHRLLQQSDPAALDAFLLQFQRTSRIDATAVVRAGQVMAQSGIAMPWPDLLQTRPSQEAPFLHMPETGGSLVLGAWAAVPTLPGSAVGVALRLDEAVASQLSAEIGLPVAIVERHQFEAEGEHAALREHAIETGNITTARLDQLTAYLAVVPLVAPSSEVVGVIETRLPASGVSQSLQQFIGTLLLLTVLLVVAAGVISLLLGQRLGRPMRTLTGAAARIGRGDLLTPIEVLPSLEAGQLAGTLEDMRVRLLQLTDNLRRQQAEAQAIVTGIIEGVFSVDRERRIRYLNPQAATMLGTSPEAAIGQFCGDVLLPRGTHGARPCEDQCPIVHARFRGSASATEHLVLPDGRRRTVVITSAPPVDDLQVQVMRDETDVEATRRLRDAILANISHEFRTPLSAQLASIELLLDQLPELSVDQIEELVRSQQRSTLRLTQLIDNLLESARVEAGMGTIRRQPVALDDVVEEAVELTRPLLEQRDQAVLVDLPYPLPSISGDARRLTQVFVNLLGNANKFAPADSTIEIGGAVDNATVSVWIADQGPGLPAGSSQRLFERFVRSGQDEPEQSGVGLGLSLVKSIVERHGGRVEVQPNTVGTRMNVVLPRERVIENTDSR